MVDKKSKGTKIFLDKRNTGALKQMVTRGLSKQVFSIHPFTLEEGLCSFISEVPGLKPKRVSKQKQSEMLGKIMEDPFF